MKKKAAKRKSTKKDANNDGRGTVEEKITSAEKSFDFGGLPERDLKKNLGCG